MIYFVCAFGLKNPDQKVRKESLALFGFSLNLKLVISAEAIAHTVKSFGNLMQNAQIWLQTDRLIALTLTAVLLGALGEWFIRLIGRSVVRWKSR